MVGLWSAALPLLRQQVGERNFSTWIEPIRCASDEEGLRLEVPSRFFQDWITRHFLPTIRDTLTLLAGQPCAVRTVIGGALPPKSRPAAPASSEQRVEAPRGPRIGQLVAHYTFETFVVGPSNEIAYRAMQEVGAAPGRRFNPAVVHGGVGLGKTHLINGLAHEVLRRWPRVRVACLSGESFMNILISSLRQDQMAAFRDRFRQVDLLILDDVQFLAGKERTQEEFFHTFNALYGSGKQIVLTSDKPPSAIAGLEERLRSRFEGGMIADIHPPTAEMRFAIVHAKADRQSIQLPDDVAKLLVDRAGPSVRELEGALTRVAATAAVRGVPITMALAEAALGPYVPMRNTVSVEAVQEAVSQHFGLTVGDLKSHRRGRDVAFPRQVAMYLSRVTAEASFPSIAEKFGGRDHSTVMHAVRVIEGRRATDKKIDQLISVLDGQLRA